MYGDSNGVITWSHTHTLPWEEYIDELREGSIDNENKRKQISLINYVKPVPLDFNIGAETNCVVELPNTNCWKHWKYQLCNTFCATLFVPHCGT